MKRIALLILIAVVAISSAEAQNVKRTKHKEKDKFKWYLIEHDGYQGAETKEGKSIIPLEKKFKEVRYRYSSRYYTNGFFIAYKKDADGKSIVGVYNRNGVEKISPDRGYSYAYVDDILWCDDHIVVKNENVVGLCDTNGREIIAPKPHYRDFKFYPFLKISGYYIAHYKDKSCGIVDSNGREVIPPGRGYTHACPQKSNGHIFFEVKKGDSVGLCDIYGDEIVAPKKIDYFFSFKYAQDCFMYVDYARRYFYLGVKLDKDGHGIPDPYHVAGTPYTEDNLAESTYQQKEQRNYTPQNQYNNYQATPTYNNNSQQPSQHHNNNTPVREKCKYCMGSGKCQGLNSPGGTRTIKMHCNGSGRCSTCGGKGLMSDGFGSQIKCSDCSYTGKCRFCKGTGKCDRCGGTGYR